MLLLTQAQHRGGHVVSAASLEHLDQHGPALLVATDTHSACYTAAVGGGALDLRWEHVWGDSRGSRLEHVGPLVAGGTDAAYLVITAARGGFEVAVAAACDGPRRVLASLALPLAVMPQGDPPSWRPAFSNVVRCQPSSGTHLFVMAASLQQGSVHVVRAEHTASSGWALSAAATPLCNLLTAEPGEALHPHGRCLRPQNSSAGSPPPTLAAQAANCPPSTCRSSSFRPPPPPALPGATLVVESLCVGAPSAWRDAGDRLHCVLLYSSHWLGCAIRVKHVACLELAAAGGELGTCCWFLGWGLAAAATRLLAVGQPRRQRAAWAATHEAWAWH